jgi:hypothetical protein
VLSAPNALLEVGFACAFLACGHLGERCNAFQYILGDNKLSSAQSAMLFGATLGYIIFVVGALYAIKVMYSTSDGSSTWGMFSLVLFFYQNLNFGQYFAHFQVFHCVRNRWSLFLSLHVRAVYGQF